MKIPPTVVSSLMLWVTGCSTSNVAKNESTTGPEPSVSFTVQRAIAKVNDIGGTVFLAKPGIMDSNIYDGGLNWRAPVPGILQTKVQQVGANTYLVTFIEQWSASKFPVKGDKNTGEHC